MSDKELKVMESKVREVMETCPQTKAALDTLFGEQFPPPKLQIGDIVRGKGKYSGEKIDGYYGVIQDQVSVPTHGSLMAVLFFDRGRGWGRKEAYWNVPVEQLELVYRP